MSLADYLAKNYLTADPGAANKTKKRKRKDVKPANGLVIADDDAAGWLHGAANDEDDTPVTVSGRSAEFRKTRKNNWTTVGAPAPSNSEQAAADAIIASAAAEDDVRRANDDEQPAVVDTADAPTMESGVRAGLQSAAQVAEAMRRRKAEEQKEFEEGGLETAGKRQETIYRDASGRIINVAMKRAEARRAAEEEERKKAAEIEAQQGDVQRLQKERRKQKLEDAKYMPIARYADDVELNEELKERERWNDPAAQFLTSKKSAKSATGKPLYQGAAPPNRYGIRPGHKWDGVDRSNGFEKQYFAAQNRRKDARELEYAWQMDE